MVLRDNIGDTSLSNTSEYRRVISTLAQPDQLLIQKANRSNLRVNLHRDEKNLLYFANFGFRKFSEIAENVAGTRAGGHDHSWGRESDVPAEKRVPTSRHPGTLTS